LLNNGFQTVYNHIGLELKQNIPPRDTTLCIGNLKFGEMEFGEMKRNTSNWSNFCMLLRRSGLSASAGLSCLHSWLRPISKLVWHIFHG